VTRPDYIPESLWDATKNAPKGDDLGKILTAHQARQANLIDDPAKFDLKPTVKAADGQTFEFDTESPLMKGVLGMAKGRFTKEDVRDLGDLVLTAQVAAKDAEHAEFLTIGGGDEAKAHQRFNAVMAKGAALLGQDGKETPESKKAFTQVLAVISTKAQFEVLEKLVGLQGLPGAAGGTGNTGGVIPIAQQLYPNENRKAG
jgi:hypothetical protein